ncbi:MAG TPA: DNA polymerase III subunit alpha [Steroidobacteraceae bacterium]|jgi:DNA polymerase-3 subunit alpha|nr:DNA polymerase III subunit alpha [Steroidobacteraceae bacterium]
MSAGFVHLRLHTGYSLRDSVVRVPELMEAVAAAHMPAVALTDHSNLFAMIKFYRAALARGIQPIIGVDLLLREPEEPARPSRLTLLCQNLAGYRNLSRLLSRAYLQGQGNGEALIERGWLDAGNCAGLIALSGAAEGDIGRALLRERAAAAGQALDGWLALFGERFYIELQRLGRADEAAYLPAAVALAARRGVPLVATNDVRFLTPAEFESHEARVCIHDGALLADAARPRRYTPQQYLRGAEEMALLFHDLPEALANSVQIARRCSLALKLGESRLPDYPVPEGDSPNQYLRAQAERGLQLRQAASPLPPETAERYDARLASELAVICPMGFAGYFLIVADFIRWAREHGVPVGPGRGSGAGSLVAYALRITDIDPLRHDLLFERFLNPERVSMPDFDIDFCMEGRDRVIDYVADKYGHDRVSQIITYGTMAAKAVVRDVGRVLGHPYGFVDRIAKLIPFELGITLDDALGKEPELKRLYREDEEVHNLLDLARSLEGLTRNAGKHAGGVVIAPSVLTDFTPLYCEPGGAGVITQFDKDDVEAAGLVKFDFLGLRTLTILDWALATVNAARTRAGQGPLELSELPMNDAASYALLKSCRTTAVFQLESRGMKDLIRRLQPDCFEDIVAVNALFRPGPLQSGMVDDFIARKHAPAGQAIDYLHPDLKPVLSPTYGVILYQEQVMQIAQVLAGYTLGGADLLRRAMGKKKPEEMAKQRSVFVDGARARGVSERLAAHIFDLMEKFAGYGFNKSHSAAYALLSYQTAYLKAHYPAAFMAAVLSADMDRTDKIVTLIDECAQMGLTVQPPDVNASSYAFAVADEGTIRYGLGAIKGVGRAAVDAIVEERTAHGPYASLSDLCRRIDLARVSRRTLEALVRAGSLDCLGLNRATLMTNLETATQAGEQAARSHEAGQVDLFGSGASGPGPDAGAPAVPARASMGAPAPAPVTVPEWSASQRLAGERETLGLYLSGHPIAPYEADLRHFASGRIAEFMAERAPTPTEGGRPYADARTVTLAGLILEVRRRAARVSFILDDRSGRIEVTLFEETYQRHRDLIVKDTLVQVEGSLRFDDFSDAWRLAAKQIVSLAAVRERLARALVLTWPQPPAAQAALAPVEGLLRAARGGHCSVLLRYCNREARGTVSCADEWKVRVTPELLEQLEGLLGAGAVRLAYASPAAATAVAH